MTREEALQILDTIPTISEQVDALEMAIQALSQEPCEGCDYKEWLKGEIEPQESEEKNDNNKNV